MGKKIYKCETAVILNAFQEIGTWLMKNAGLVTMEIDVVKETIILEGDFDHVEEELHEKMLEFGFTLITEKSS